MLNGGFMSLFKRKRRISTGLEITNDVFRVLSLEHSDNAYVVVHNICDSIPYELCITGDPFFDYGAHLSPIFKYIADRVGIFDEGVNIALPLGDALIHVVDMPGLNLEEVRAALRYKIKDYFPFPVDDCVYDVASVDFPNYTDIPEKRFAVAAASRKLVENIMRAADENGIQIDSIEPAQVAAERSITPLYPEDVGSVYVYVGTESSVLVLSWRGNGIFYSSLSCGEDEDICSEIRKGIDFAQSRCSDFSAKILRIFGPGASDELCKDLADSAENHIAELSNPFEVHSVNGIADTTGREIVLGLALR